MASAGGYQVEFTKPARKELDQLPRDVQARVVTATERLSDDPRPHGCEKLKGYDGRYRIRVGDYRIVYEISDERLIVLIVRVADRKDVYRP